MLRLRIIGASKWQTLERALAHGQREYARAFKDRLRKAGQLIRRQQRQDLDSGKGPQQRKKEYAGFKRKRSNLRAAHAVVLKKSGGAFTQGWELFVGPTPGGDAFYGKFAELGTQMRRTKKGLNRGMQPATPWMRDAYGPVAPQVEAIMDGALRPVADAFRIGFAGRGAVTETLAGGD